MRQNIAEREDLPGMKSHAGDWLARRLVVLAPFENLASDIGEQRLAAFLLRLDQLAIGKGD